MKKARAFLILSLMIPLIASAQENASLEEMRQAAEKGNAEAQMEVGILYEFGYNMPKNTVNALTWYIRAAEQGNALAIKRRDQIKARMTAAEIEEAQKQASTPITAASAPATAPAAPPESTLVPAAPTPAVEKPEATFPTEAKTPATP